MLLCAETVCFGLSLYLRETRGNLLNFAELISRELYAIHFLLSQRGREAEATGTKSNIANFN